MIVGPGRFPDDDGASWFQAGVQSLKNLTTVFPDMMQGAIHGDEVGSLWQGKLMDIAFIKMQAIRNALPFGFFRSLADVFGETI